MAVSFAPALRDARLQAIINSIDAGPGQGKLNFYTGTRPATGAAITTEVLLGTLLLSDPSATIAAGVLTLEPIADDVSADADGTISWARLTDSTDTFVADFNCGTSASDINCSTLVVAAGDTIRVTSASLNEGNA